MSSTKRGGKRSPADNYPTPQWCVHRFLEEAELKLPGGRWLEAGVGNGDIVKATLSLRADVTFTGFDLRETKFLKEPGVPGDFFVGNFLKPEGRVAELFSGPTFDVTIGNPPYRLATEFLYNSLRISTYVVFLLRLNYLGSDTRSGFMQSHTPDVYVLPNRPSFRPSARGKLTTDSIEYGWFVWGPERRTQGCLKVLKTTSKEIRRHG